MTDELNIAYLSSTMENSEVDKCFDIIFKKIQKAVKVKFS